PFYLRSPSSPALPPLHSFPTRRSSDLAARFEISATGPLFGPRMTEPSGVPAEIERRVLAAAGTSAEELNSARTVKYSGGRRPLRSEEHTSELQSRGHLVCRLLLEKKKQ